MLISSHPSQTFPTSVSFTKAIFNTILMELRDQLPAITQNMEHNVICIRRVKTTTIDLASNSTSIAVNITTTAQQQSISESPKLGNKAISNNNFLRKTCDLVTIPILNYTTTPSYTRLPSKDPYELISFIQPN